MKKSLGVKPYTYPMPVLMIATYNEDNTVNVMNMAWGGVCGSNRVALNISKNHKTYENLEKRKGFTLSVPDVSHVKEADFFGIASGNKMSDKFERTGMTASKSEKIDAPIVDAFPLTLECEVVEFQDQPYGLRVLGKIVDVLVDAAILDDSGQVIPEKLNAFIFDTLTKSYYSIGQKVGGAWDIGRALMDD